MALSVAEVRSALDEGDESIRLGAVSRLDLSEPGALEVLVRAMADRDWRVRREAVERSTTGAIRRDDLVSELVPLLAEPDDVGLRNAVIDAVVALGHEVLPALHAALAARPDHRKILCDVLGRIGQSSSAKALTSVLDAGSEDENVRIAAAEALGRIRQDGADEDELVARSLRSALAGLLLLPVVDHAAFFGSAILDAMARRKVALTAAELSLLASQRVLGAGALRAVANGAVGTDSKARAAAFAIAVRYLADSARARREAALLATARLSCDGDAISLEPVARAATTEALLEGTVEVQRAAARVLGLSGDAASARPLLVAIDDAALFDAATEGLALLARRNVAALMEVAETLSLVARAAVYRAVARAGSEVHGTSTLVMALHRDLDSDEDVLAVAAAEALGALGDGSAAERLATALTDAEDRGSEDRSLAAQRALAALARRHPAAVTELARERSGASFVALLGNLGSASDVEILVARLGDGVVEIRRAAATALAAVAARRVSLRADLAARAIEAARTGLLDESPLVRAAAAGAVARLEALHAEVSPAAVAALLLAARDEDVRVRGAAARALVDLGTIAKGDATALARNGLRALADGRDELTAVTALEALLAQGDDADDPRLLDALTGHDDERRKVALYALVARPRLLGRGELMRIAQRALHDVRWDLRRAAIAALVAVGRTGRSALVGRRASESDPLVRADLERALAAGEGGG